MTLQAMYVVQSVHLSCSHKNIEGTISIVFVKKRLILLISSILIYKIHTTKILTFKKGVVCVVSSLCFLLKSSNLLMVPSHQIRSAWKWYGWLSPDELKSLNITFSSPSGIAKHDLALNAICRFACKVNKRGNRFLLATAPKVIWALLANWQRVTHRMQ